MLASKTRVARPSAISFTANPLPTVVFPQPGGPSTARNILASCAPVQYSKLLTIKRNVIHVLQTRHHFHHVEGDQLLIYEICALVQELVS